MNTEYLWEHIQIYRVYVYVHIHFNGNTGNSLHNCVKTANSFIHAQLNLAIKNENEDDDHPMTAYTYMT